MPLQTALVLYGGGDVEYTRPNFVPIDKWHLAGTYMSSKSEDDVVRSPLLPRPGLFALAV